MPLNIFKQITQIPRPSGKEEKMVEFVKNFALQNNISFKVDSFNNILLKKKTADVPVLCLQAHLDMVCVKELNKAINFETQGLSVFEKDGFLQADGTSLGADNGIGVAMALKILQEDFPMNLEVVLTAEEETTMNGAKNFDVSLLKAKYMINLDGSSNNKIDISSASTTEYSIRFPKLKKLFDSQIESAFASKPLNVFQVDINGFFSRHSGLDVVKNLGNDFKTAFDYFDKLGNVYFIDIESQSKSNEIRTNDGNYVFTN